MARRMETDKEEIMNQEIEFDDEIENDIFENLHSEEIVVFSRDWTIETIFSQIEQGNIDLNPKFQRRNAWKDDRRSRLIESLIIGFPVPEIVLAEHPEKKKSFMVIDGKQRLLTIAGFIKPERFQTWETPKLRSLGVKPKLNNLTFDMLKKVPEMDNGREFLNSDIRCTIISNFKNYDVLYDIFYRLNTGSVPLSGQELRQVLHKGDFADFLMEITATKQPIHNIMRLNDPDPRLKDVEIILRFICLTLFSKEHRGDLRKFLDNSMGKIAKDWGAYKKKIEEIYETFNHGVENLIALFGEDAAGRKYKKGAYEKRLNRSLLEVEIFFFSQLPKQLVVDNQNEILGEFKKLLEERDDFNKAISISTNNLDAFFFRFKCFREFLENTIGGTLSILEFDYKTE